MVPSLWDGVSGLTSARMRDRQHHTVKRVMTLKVDKPELSRYYSPQCTRFLFSLTKMQILLPYPRQVMQSLVIYVSGYDVD